MLTGSRTMYLSSRKKEFEGENEEKRNVFGGGIQA
jgi:hypothetical protein